MSLHFPSGKLVSYHDLILPRSPPPHAAGWLGWGGVGGEGREAQPLLRDSGQEPCLTLPIELFSVQIRIIGSKQDAFIRVYNEELKGCMVSLKQMCGRLD